MKKIKNFKTKSSRRIEAFIFIILHLFHFKSDYCFSETADLFSYFFSSGICMIFRTKMPAHEKKKKR